MFQTIFVPLLRVGHPEQSEGGSESCHRQEPRPLLGQGPRVGHSRALRRRRRQRKAHLESR